jgi:hypothetical protein
LKIYHHGAPSASVAALCRLSCCLGVDAHPVLVDSGAGLVAELGAAACSGELAVVLDTGSLARICDANAISEISERLGASRLAVLLLFNREGPGDRILRGITRGSVDRVESTGPASVVSFPGEMGKLARELRSRSYARERGEALGFRLRSPEAVEVIMTVDGMPSFVRDRRTTARVFAWATPLVFDVRRPLDTELEFEQALDAYVPAILFLREVYGERCWRNPRIGAGLVIDDPLLRERYGYIDFPKLLDSARAMHYHVTLAFIPWNYWRIRVSDARPFLEHTDCFGLCAHGCDHVKAEFGGLDYEDLVRRVFLARDRLERLYQKTGLRSEPLMVFPQECYSLEALRALADSRQFLGVVNTGCVPRDAGESRICGADLLLPAQDALFGFPVFKRHYSKDIAALALGVFLGKPAILVEHHEFFRDGPVRAEEHVAALASIQPRSTWMSLADVTTTTHLRRRAPSGEHEVRFFTDRFRLLDVPDEAGTYRFFRRMPRDAALRRVLVDGQEVEFARRLDEEFVVFETAMHGRSAVSVELEVAPRRPAPSRSARLTEHAATAARRVLSELRDNLISRNRFALTASRAVMRALKQTGV